MNTPPIQISPLTSTAVHVICFLFCRGTVISQVTGHCKRNRSQYVILKNTRVQGPLRNQAHKIKITITYRKVTDIARKYEW